MSLLTLLRSTAPPPVTWNTTPGVNCNANLQFSANKLSFSQINYVGNADYVRASAAAPDKFIVEVDTGATVSGGFWVGVDDGTPDFSVTNFNSAASTASSVIREDGNWTAFKNGAWTGYQVGASSVPNGILTLAGDKTAGTLEIFFNGTLLTTITGIAYSTWYLFAGNQDFSGVADLTANFKGPFTYPQTGYSAYDSGAAASAPTRRPYGYAFIVG